ncbi:hypothetical protein MMUR_27480 [Mycolicibacterium murale]|uniref:Uncharacterized protein n=1 Tax=Mycolicibacterium murale TaxID=182220 RepID=A0A7I9WLJ1_9MYCO|nr:hypothetical protein MMUR_27480 [Mycolicibacterium murale]
MTVVVMVTGGSKIGDPSAALLPRGGVLGRELRVSVPWVATGVSCVDWRLSRRFRPTDAAGRQPVDRDHDHLLFANVMTALMCLL